MPFHPAPAMAVSLALPLAYSYVQAHKTVLDGTPSAAFSDARDRIPPEEPLSLRGVVVNAIEISGGVDRNLLVASLVTGMARMGWQKLKPLLGMGSPAVA